MTTVTVNDNASGVWARRAGTKLELVGEGLNELHVIVRRPGCRKTFGLPTRWLDGLPVARVKPTRPAPCADCVHVDEGCTGNTEITCNVAEAQLSLATV